MVVGACVVKTVVVEVQEVAGEALFNEAAKIS